jgi:hypothetical protein
VCVGEGVNKEFNDSMLAKRHIVVGHFVRSDTGRVMQAIDVTRHSRITQLLILSTTILSFVCCSQFACKKKVAHDFVYDPRIYYGRHARHFEISYNREKRERVYIVSMAQEIMLKWTDADMGYLKYSEKILPLCYIVHNRSHVNLPGIKLWPL